jgi:hypothetical protein
MIVRSGDDGIQLMAQPDRAHLARVIMERCTTLASRPRPETILQATGEHDAGWAQEDAAPTVKPQTGTVVDFVSVPIRVRHAVWPRTRVVVTPDACGGQEIPIKISAREIRAQLFRSDAELRDALSEANRTTTSQVSDVTGP